MLNPRETKEKYNKWLKSQFWNKEVQKLIYFQDRLTVEEKRIILKVTEKL